MATSFLNIYTRAMSMLKSPFLSRLQKNDILSYCIVMENYLQTARTFYNPNAETYARLSNVVPSSNGEQDFVGDGVKTEFTITDYVKTNTDTIFKVSVNDVVSMDYIYNEQTNQIIFNTPPQLNAKIVVEWVGIGTFLNEITNEDIALLAIATCWAWAIQIENDELDINRSLNDSGDFKQHSNATTTNAKVNWQKHFEEMFKRELSKADWRPMFRNKWTNVTFNGTRANDIDQIIDIFSNSNTKVFLVKG